MLRASSLLLSFALVPAAIALPTVTRPQPSPHPVAPRLHTVSFAASGSAVQAESDFRAVGATWTPGTLRPGAEVQVRVRAAGRWSGWTAMPAADVAPDPGSKDAQAAAAAGKQASEPLWVDHADAVQTRVVSDTGAPAPAPQHLDVVLIDPGTSAADAHPGPATAASSAEAAISQPTIYTRAQWGADESLRSRNGSGCTTPDYSSTIKVGFVHHTATSNSYSSADVPAIIRSIYSYHVINNGWCDIGYNFLVDKFGRIWEGRYGGIDKPVIGAHTGGFNRDSFAASLIGNYQAVTPSSAALSAVERLFAWKLSRYYRDPRGTDQLIYAGGGFCSTCTVGQPKTLYVISGHRDADVGHTECPGDAAWAQLPGIRTATAAALGAGLVSPSASTSRLQYYGTDSVTVSAKTVTTQTWTLHVLDAAGSTVRTLSGSASRSTPISATWDRKTSLGAPAMPGNYRLELDSAAGSSSARPYTAPVSIAPPVTVTGPETTPWNSTVQLVGRAPAGATVQLHLHKRFVSGYVDGPTAVADANGAYTIPWTFDDDYRYYATAASFTSDKGLTQIAPTLEGPSLGLPGATIELTGTARPGEPVTIMTHKAGQDGYSSGPAATAGQDGSFTVPFVLDQDYRFYAVAADNPSGGVLTQVAPDGIYPVATHEPLNTDVQVRGVAPQGVTVTLMLHKRGTDGYTAGPTTTADAQGIFGFTVKADDDYRLYASWPGGATPSQLTQISPTLTGPPKVAKGSTVTLTGTARPETSVIIYFHRRGQGGYTARRWLTTDAQGRYGTTYYANDDYRYYATSHGWSSVPDLTQLS